MKLRNSVLLIVKIRIKQADNYIRYWSNSILPYLRSLLCLSSTVNSKLMLWHSCSNMQQFTWPNCPLHTYTDMSSSTKRILLRLPTVYNLVFITLNKYMPSHFYPVLMFDRMKERTLQMSLALLCSV